VVDLLDGLIGLPSWIRAGVFGLGLALLWYSYRQWRLSWSGSGYKGITGQYWTRLALLLVLGLGGVGVGVLTLVFR